MSAPESPTNHSHLIVIVFTGLVTTIAGCHPGSDPVEKANKDVSDASVTTRSTAAPPPSPENPSIRPGESRSKPAGGQLAFTQLCLGCHGAQGQGTAGGPKLARTIAYKDFESAVRRPQGRMPAFSTQMVSDPEMVQLHEYTISVASGAGPSSSETATAVGGSTAAVHGKNVYMRIGCYACHGTVGQGAVTGPRLAPAPLAYDTFSQFIRHHPSDRMPRYSPRVLADEELIDLYEYMKSIPPHRSADDIPLLRR